MVNCSIHNNLRWITAVFAISAVFSLLTKQSLANTRALRVRARPYSILLSDNSDVSAVLPKQHCPLNANCKRSAQACLQWHAVGVRTLLADDASRNNRRQDVEDSCRGLCALVSLFALLLNERLSKSLLSVTNAVSKDCPDGAKLARLCLASFEKSEDNPLETKPGSDRARKRAVCFVDFAVYFSLLLFVLCFLFAVAVCHWTVSW